MAYLKKIKLDSAEGKALTQLSNAKNSIGKEINLTATMANAPSVLEAYLNFNSALSRGVLDKRLREKIAISAAGHHKCAYCASAHTYIGGNLGISDAELNANYDDQSADEKTDAALNFVHQLIQERGQIADNTLQELKSAGFSDEEIIEILAHVAINTFTNYFNLAFQTEIDFPLFSRQAA